MLFVDRSPRWSYVTALVGSGLVLLIDAASRGPLQIFLGTVGFIFAVLAAAALGGWKPGLLATALCVVGYLFFFLQPYYSFRVSNSADLLSLLGYVLVGGAISILCEALHVAGARLHDRQQKLEQEIVEHRRTDLALRKAEQHAQAESERSREAAALLRVTIASIGDGVMTTDADGGVTYMNTVAEALTGWTEADARGRPLSDVFRIVNERTREAVENPCAKVLATGAIVGLANHTILIGKNGRELPIDDSAAPIADESGRVLGVVLVFRDATKERAATEALQRLAAIVEHSHDAIIGKTLDGTITSWNAAAENLYGFTAEEAIGRPISIMVPPDRMDELARIMDRLKSGQAIEHLETVRLRKDGSRVDVSLAISPIKDSYGEVIGASKIARDISEAKRVREAVERSERHLNDFFENSAIGLHWVGPDGTVLRVNQAELDLLGYAREEYIGHHIAEFHADQNVIDDILACLKRLETIQSYEARLRCKDGSIKHVLIDSNVYSEDGEFIHTRCFTRDITDRKKAEDHLRLLVDASDSVAAVVDVQSSMQKLARQAVPTFGDWCAIHLVSEKGEIERLVHAHAEPGKDALLDEFLRLSLEWNSRAPQVQVLRSGRSALLRDLTPGDFVPVAQEDRHRELFEQLGVQSSLVVPLESRGRVIGTLTFARSASRPQFTEDDVEVGEDVAKRAATAIENCRLYEELRLADRQKDDFLAMLAHELRNPLAAISYAGQLFSTSPEHSGSAIEIIARQVKQLSNLINDLLDVSRITRGIIQLKKEGIDARTLVDRALGTTRPLLEQQGHMVTRDIATEELPLFVDPTRVEQILVNVITNAAKYTPKGGQVSIRAAVEGKDIVIRVKDSGIGIPPEMLPRVFDMFTQVDPSIDRAQGGLGIGLTVVRRLVEMHEGNVSALSEGLGKGTEFTIRFPRGRAQPHQTSSPAAESAGVRPGLRVLVVDDNVDTATTVSLLLQKAGCVTETAYDGPSALDRATHFHPDAAVLDIGLPGFDGYELAKRFRANAELKPMKLIAISGYGQEQDRSRAKDAGFDHHLVKPVEFESLSRLLSESHSTT